MMLINSNYYLSANNSNHLAMNESIGVSLDSVQSTDGNPMRQAAEQKSDRFLKLDIMGDEFRILVKIAKQIPFLEALLETKPHEQIIIDGVSPKFFRFLDDFLKNDEHISIFKKNIDIFKREKVEYWLKYLEMDQLYRTLFGCKHVGKRLVIDDAITILDSYQAATGFSIVYRLCDGTYVNTVPGDALVCVSAVKCIKNDNPGYMIQSKDGRGTVFLRPYDLVEDGNMVFVSLESAVQNYIISHYASVRDQLAKK